MILLHDDAPMNPSRRRVSMNPACCCQTCGRPRKSRHDIGRYCQTCLLQTIEQVFVHAADQPAGRNRKRQQQRIQDDSSTTSGDTPSSRTFSGDEGDSTSFTTRQTTVSRRENFSARHVSASQRYVSVDIRPVQQMQMLADFLNSYFPTAQARAELANRRSYLAALPDIDTSSTPILRTAVDTLCFAHLGSKTNDSRLIRESQTSYGRVLNLLIQATSRSNPNLEPKAVVTSIMLLSLYDDSNSNKGWATHYWGSLELLKAHGPGVLNMRDPFDRLIFWNLRMPCFFLGIARRKSIILGEEKWLALSGKIPESRGPLTQFYVHAMGIPALLERTDTLIASRHEKDRGEELSSLYTTLQQTLTHLQEWFDSETSNPEISARETPSSFPITSTSNFNFHIEEHVYLSTTGTYPHLYHWPSFPSGLKLHTLLLTTQLLLTCTLLRLHHFLPSLGPSPELEKAAFDLAGEICKSVYHYAALEGLAYADFTLYLLEMAEGVFLEIGEKAGRELGFVQALRVASSLRRGRLVDGKGQGNGKTLCRMGDIAAECAGGCRWRRRNFE